MTHLRNPLDSVDCYQAVNVHAENARSPGIGLIHGASGLRRQLNCSTSSNSYVGFMWYLQCGWF